MRVSAALIAMATAAMIVLRVDLVKRRNKKLCEGRKVIQFQTLSLSAIFVVTFHFRSWIRRFVCNFQ